MSTPEIVRQNCLHAVAKFNAVRAARAIESERPFWEGRAQALLAAIRVPPRGAKILFRLNAKQGTNPHFQSLCQSL